jgi:PAS domain S-box-containing protein
MKIQYKILLLAIGIGVISWIADSIISYWDLQQSFSSSLFTPQLHEVFMRLLLIVIVFLFGVYLSLLIVQRDKARQEIENIAQFPLEDSNPVLRLDCDGVIIFANEASVDVLKAWQATVGGSAPEFWRKWVCETIENGKPSAVDAVFSDKTFTITIVPVPSKSYANLYGSDVTLRRAAEKALRKAHDELETKVDERTAELRASNQLLKEAEGRTQATNALLNLFVQKSTRKEYLESAVKLLSDWSGCENVGIRVLNDQGYIPYEASIGFNDEFLAKENHLSVYSDHCACIRVVLGAPLPREMATMTPQGSFVTNDSNDFLAGLDQAEQANYRGECVRSDFASLAVVPIRYQDKITAAIHLANRQPGSLPPRIVEFVESISTVIGEALHRFAIEEELRQANEALLERSKMLEAFFSHSVTPLVFLDKEFNFIRVNKAYALACKRDISDFVGNNHFVDYPSDELKVEFQRVVETGKPYHIIERPFVFPDYPEWGTSYWDLTLIPILDEKGEVDFLVFSLEDVTAHKQADEELTRYRIHLEELVSERSAEILRINEQLKAEIEERKRTEAELERLLNELTVNEQRLRWAMQAGKGGAWDWDLTTSEAWWSPEMYDLWGVPRDIPMFTENSMDVIDERDREMVMNVITECISNHTNPQYEFRIKHPLYGELWMATFGKIIYDAGNRAVRILGITMDVTDQKQVEQKLEKAVAELSRSNEELEQFAYVASHDLQEPLRMVSSYVGLLARRYKGKLEADADDFINYAVDGAERMRQLIADLLHYSRVGTCGKPFQPFSMQEALQQAMDNLRIVIQETGAQITNDQLPVITGDQPQIVQLFQNLLDNAIKFRDAEGPRVHVGAKWQNDYWIFSVSDNGIGIDPKQYDRIFQIFQRLNSSKKYPGTGIGLAVCKKIVERHGGRIWVQPGQNQGTIINFTIA